MVQTAIAYIRKGSLHRHGQRFNVFDENNRQIVFDSSDPETEVLKYFKDRDFNGYVCTKWHGAPHASMVHYIGWKNGKRS